MLHAQSDVFPSVGFDLRRPSSTRISNYLIGGTANWAVDREFVRRALDSFPALREVVRANRLFLSRAVRYLADVGVRQFIDVGGGAPTLHNTHRVAETVSPDCRVVYVENDPVAAAHAELQLDQDGDPYRWVVVQADLRHADELWDRAEDTLLIDPEEPVALLVASSLNTFQAGTCGDELESSGLARYRDLVPPGSYLVLSHVTDDGVPREMVDRLAELRSLYDRSCTSRLGRRSRAEFAGFFGDFELVEPGIAWTPDWRPDGEPSGFATAAESVVLAGVGRKPR